jgi:hypothetical protein
MKTFIILSGSLLMAAGIAAWAGTAAGQNETANAQCVQVCEEEASCSESCCDWSCCPLK